MSYFLQKDRSESILWLRCLYFTLFAFIALPTMAFAHGVTDGDKGYISEISGVNIVPFIYLGAKHMITGYDHI